MNNLQLITRKGKDEEEGDVRKPLSRKKEKEQVQSVISEHATRIAKARFAAAVTLSLVAGSIATASTAHAIDGMAMLPAASHHKIEHPMRGRAPKPATSNGSGSLTYRGGVHGIGVTTGAPKVYLVFWGAGWGTQGSSGADITLSGDPKNVAPVLQEFFRGLGTNSELWSGVLTQYCDGVAVGATTCSAASAHVGYPTGGALAGVVYDGSTAAPLTASDAEIAATAVRAALLASGFTLKAFA